MAIIAKEGTGAAFVPCPAGSQAGVCVDVVDLGLIENAKFPNEDGSPKLQHKIDVVWESSELMDTGKPFLVKKRYTLSLAEKANLRHDLESWRGKPFTDAERQGFDVEKLLGHACILSVIHKTGSKGGTFANVATVSPLMRGMAKPTATGEYVRVCDRVDETQHDDSDDFPVESPSVDDIPF